VAKKEKTVLGQLKKKKRDELLFIMEQLLERKPDIVPLMELLIALPSSPSSQQEKPSEASNKRTFDIESIQKQVKTIINKALRGGRNSVYWAAAELGQMCDIGDDFADAGQWANAQAIYITVVRETLVDYEGLEDECQIAEVVDGCAGALVFCLDMQRELPENEQLDAASRKELLAALLNIWDFEHDYGGINVDIESAIIRNVRDNEGEMVAEWIQHKLTPDPSNIRNNQVRQKFLAKLTAKTLSGSNEQ
jgi:hypothetical protein